MAGGGAPVPQGGSGKKTVDFQLNLVPFIDLLSVLISFLLMTATWTQVARIEARQQASLPSDEIPPEPEREPLDLTIVVKQDGFEITQKGQPFKNIAKTADGYNLVALDETLKEVAANYADNREVTVGSVDGISYSSLVGVMELCVKHNMDEITVAGFQDEQSDG